MLPVGVAAPALPAPNLVVNGSFEEGPEEIGPFKPLDKGSTAIKGWTVTRGQIDLIGTFWKSAEGKRSIDLHGSPGHGGIAQTFKTKKGAKYRVEFQLATTPGAGQRSVIVEAAGESKEFDVDDKGRTLQEMKWTKMTWEFSATATETTLEIRTSGKGDAEQGPALDDVVVREK
jgi:choice-of-anchor C domain-containing protein